MGIRRKSREIALQSLYRAELTGQELSASLDVVCRNFEVNKKALPYAEELVAGVEAHQQAIDTSIKKFAKNWRVERMSVIDRSILRVAAWEILFNPAVPAQVAIDEAIEISKVFSTDESGRFINGILDSIAKVEVGSLI
jgi:N utilization substance protein B